MSTRLKSSPPGCVGSLGTGSTEKFERSAFRSIGRPGMPPVRIISCAQARHCSLVPCVNGTGRGRSNVSASLYVTVTHASSGPATKRAVAGTIAVTSFVMSHLHPCRQRRRLLSRQAPQFIRPRRLCILVDRRHAVVVAPRSFPLDSHEPIHAGHPPAEAAIRPELERV